MINLNNSNRDLKTACDSFFTRVKPHIEDQLRRNKTFLNNYKTDRSKQYLGDYLENNIQELIKLPLRKLIKKFYFELHNVFQENYYLDKKKTVFGKVIDNILFYESQDKWDAYQLALDLKVSVCPYCNRTYITTLGTSKKKFVRGDFDHFYLKKNYPYLRLSFYNLIPCCVICNRNAKREEDTRLDNAIYPYTSGFDNTFFTYSPHDYDNLVGKGINPIDFLYKGTHSENSKTQKNVEIFRLKEQYSIHHNELNNLINKKRFYTDSYIIELTKNYPDLITSFEEAYALIFGLEFEAINDEKNPLSKFTREIAKELGFYK